MLRFALRTTGALIVIVACALGAYADGGGGNRGFFIESIAQQGGAPGTVDQVGSAMIEDVNEYQLNLDLPSGLSLYRNFDRSELTRRELLFNTAILEKAETGATLTLGSRTSMSFAREETAITDVFQQFQSGDATTTMSLRQGFGGGESSGQFTLSRSLRNEYDGDGGELSTLTQRFGVDTGIGSGMQFTGAYHTRESQESAFRLQEHGYSAGLTMALSGGEGRAHYDYLQRVVEGRTTDRTKIDLVAPFAVPGGTLMAAHSLDRSVTEGSERTDRETRLEMPLDIVVEGAEASYFEALKIRGSNEEVDRETKISMPLDIVLDGAHASYVEVLKIRGDNRDEKNVLSFMTPFRMFGHDATFEHTQTETIKNDNIKDERLMRLSADFDGGKGLIERTQMTETRGEDLEHRARLRMQTPGIGLTDWASVTASQVRDEVEGEETSRVSRVDLSVEPFEPLAVHAIYTRHEHPGQKTRDDHNIRTALSLSDSAMLRGLIQEREQVDGPPEVIRNIDITQRAGDSLDMRFGYASFGAQHDEAGDMLAQLKWDAGSNISLSASYTEFDEKKLKPLDDSSTNLQLRAGDPREIGFRAGYSSHAGREEPERSLGLATEVLGGALKFDFIRNPLDPRGKDVMLSDVYELGFKRQVMGSISLDLGYRHFAPRAGDVLDSDDFFRLQLDGGNVNEGGQIALKYLSGHFVPYPARHDPPASILDLSYEKRWPQDAGRLTVSLTHEEAPQSAVGVDDNFEAEVRYETIF